MFFIQFPPCRNPVSPLVQQIQSRTLFRVAAHRYRVVNFVKKGLVLRSTETPAESRLFSAQKFTKKQHLRLLFGQEQGSRHGRTQPTTFASFQIHLLFFRTDGKQMRVRASQTGNPK